MSNFWGMPLGGNWMFVLGPFFVVIVLWSIFWKGMALWKAARRGETAWFVALLIINTVGILEILYLYVFSKEVKPVDK